MDSRGGTVGSVHTEPERCQVGAEGAAGSACSEPSILCSVLGDSRLLARLLVSSLSVPVFSVFVLSLSAVDASQGCIRKEHRCAVRFGSEPVLSCTRGLSLLRSSWFVGTGAFV